MSFNRLSYDGCATSVRYQESVGPLAYLLNPMKYENCSKCRHEFGLVGGTAVSNIRGNIVDLESDLWGITRPGTLCPALKWHQPVGNKIEIAGLRCNQPRTIDINPVHLSPCQMIRYPPIPVPPAQPMPSCPPIRLI